MSPLKLFACPVLILAFMTSIAFAQDDWYHDREARYQGDQWRGQVFAQVRSDLDHIWSAQGASERKIRVLRRPKESSPQCRLTSIKAVSTTAF